MFIVRPLAFVLQCLNYLEYIDNYHERIRMFHVKDAGFNQPGNRAYTVAIKTGSTGPGAPVHKEMGKDDFKSIFHQTGCI